MNANNANKPVGKLIYPELSYKSIIRIISILALSICIISILVLGIRIISIH